MQDKLRAAFDQVQVGEEIQRKTQAFVARKTRGYTRISPVPRLVLAAACLLAVLVGGWLYFTPTAEINIALDQAVTLGINRGGILCPCNFPATRQRWKKFWQPGRLPANWRKQTGWPLP